TPKYAAPELLMGGTPTFETDLFSLEAICSAIESSQQWSTQDDGETTEPLLDEASSVQDLARRVKLAIQIRESRRAKTNVYTIKKPIQLFARIASPWSAVCIFFLFFSLLSRGDASHEP